MGYLSSPVRSTSNMRELQVPPTTAKNTVKLQIQPPRPEAHTPTSGSGIRCTRYQHAGKPEPALCAELQPAKWSGDKGCAENSHEVHVCPNLRITTLNDVYTQLRVQLSARREGACSRRLVSRASQRTCRGHNVAVTSDAVTGAIIDTSWNRGCAYLVRIAARLGQAVAALCTAAIASTHSWISSGKYVE
eukprot:366012-Chlamydomonas_euryale.AAC.7